MVFYFTSTAVDPPAFIYVGKDKVESSCCDILGDLILIYSADEDLIKFGWEKDVW